MGRSRGGTPTSLACIPIVLVAVSCGLPWGRPDPDGPGPCSEGATAIFTIQGTSGTSPLAGEVHTIEGVVIADFQRSEELNGFFVQEEAHDADGDPATSDAIFVFEGPSELELQVADLVRVTGTVQEFSGQTQITDVTTVLLCASGVELPEETAILFPLPEGERDLEALEGMRVVLPQTMSVTGTFELGRYGEVLVSRSEGEPFQFQGTEREAPGSAALRERDSRNLRSRIVIDDASTRRSPDPVPILGAFDPKTLRRGDTTDQPLRGVVANFFDSYRLEPTSRPSLVRARPRPESPPEVGGDLRVASFNLFNYFATLDDGLGGDDGGPRGADSANELARQERKLVAALCALDADIVALQELENTGDRGSESAIATLVAALDPQCPGYRWVDTGTTGQLGVIGADAITVGLLYRSAVVEPVGGPALLESGSFDGLSRPPVAQTFRSRARPDAPALTVVANHFKSKGCTGAEEADLDQGDGQACFNHTRVASAREMIAWLATDPTGSGSSDLLVMGDFNAYTEEDPIRTLESSGLVNLVRREVDEPERYSYVYGGMAGLIDHAFASPGLAERVSGVGIWHINADEPRVLDYNDSVQDPGDSSSEANPDDSLYIPDPFRSSDHDPVIVGIRWGRN